MAKVEKNIRLERHPNGSIVLKYLNKSQGPAVPTLKRKGLLNPELNVSQGGSHFTEKVERK